MARPIRHRHNKNLLTPEKVIRGGVDLNNAYKSEESALWESVSEYMKGRFDLEDVRLDPELSSTTHLVNNMISDYHKKGTRKRDDEKFIRDNFFGETGENEVQDEINNIKLEISNSNIDEITAEWVKEWHERRESQIAVDPHSDEIREYILNSFESESSGPEMRKTSEKKKGFSKSLFFYISLSAAAVIGAFFLINTLLPSYNPDRLYNSYYEPMNIVLPVTRSLNTGESDTYSSGISKYKAGDYQHAVIDFSTAVMDHKSATAPLFFSGITYLALGNYDQAVSQLSEVSNRPGEYSKEAEWYLGLAYLKTGAKDKAFGCFDFLLKTPGFYHDRAEKILRHLR